MVFWFKLAFILALLFGVVSMAIGMNHKKNQKLKTAFGWVVRALITLGWTGFLSLLMACSPLSLMGIKAAGLSLIAVVSGAVPFEKNFDSSKKATTLFHIGGVGYILAMLATILVVLTS